MAEGLKTLTRYTIEEEHRHPGSTGDFSGLLNVLATAVKIIANQVNKGALIGSHGTAGVQQAHGEVEKKLNVISNDVMLQETQWAGHVAGMVSEEMDGFYAVPARYRRGKYLLAFDPLDGSGNLDVNMSLGTIFTILRNPDLETEPSGDDFLQPGTEQVCAGFALYGPATMLVLTAGNGVDGFTLDREIGAFVLTHPQMRIPEEASEFAINACNERFWEQPVKRYVQECLDGGAGNRGRDFTMRWVASLVADTYRILTLGGVYLDPRDAKDPEQVRRRSAAVRGESDRLHHRAGRRRREHRARAGAGTVPGDAAPAGPVDVRLEARGGADRAVPPGIRAARRGFRPVLFTVRSLFRTTDLPT